MVVIRIIIRGGAGGGGEANTLSSVGGGTSPLSATVSKVGVDLRVKSLSVLASLIKTDVADLITLSLANLPLLGTLPASPRQVAILNAEISTVDASKITTGSLAFARGGTTGSSAQTGMNLLSAVAGATNEHVLTKDTASGNAIFKVAAGGAGQTFARVVKKVDETVNNSTTLQNDNEFVVAVNANKTYGFLLWTMITSSAVANFKHTFTVPAGASGTRLQGNLSSNSSATNRSFTLTFASTGYSGSDRWTMLCGQARIAGTAGNLQYQWAQQTAEVSDTIVREGSTFVVWEELA